VRPDTARGTALLAAVAIALADSPPPPLPTQLPAAVAGFAFGDGILALRDKCERLGARTPKDRPRFYLDPQHRFASCDDVQPDKPYMPNLSRLIFMLEGKSTFSIGADVPTPVLLEHARQIARTRGAQVEGQHFCRKFPDAVGAVCVDLETKTLMLTL
jgi:hypothetical protein